MALDNFIPTVWSARLLVNLHKALVYGQAGIINTDYEGDIKNAGDTVKIQSFGTVTVGDYAKNSDMAAPQTLQDASQMLAIDQQKYFNFQIDDIDQAQANIQVMNAAMGEAAYAMANVADQFIASKYTDIAPCNVLGSDTTPITVDTTGTAGHSAYERLVDLSILLDNGNIPEDGRWVVVPPWIEGLLLKDQRFVSFGTVQSNQRIANRMIGMIAGFNVLKSNNVPNLTNGSSQNVYQIIAGHSMAWSFADQVSEVMAYRPEKRFADAMKGLHLYGAKVTRPDGLALLKASAT
jgi:N4-gp56 family major capsid protein